MQQQLLACRPRGQSCAVVLQVQLLHHQQEAEEETPAAEQIWLDTAAYPSQPWYMCS
jgi:hypothetical protein